MHTKTFNVELRVSREEDMLDIILFKNKQEILIGNIWSETPPSVICSITRLLENNFLSNESFPEEIGSSPQDCY
jgi:hypothetical protein